MCKLFRTSLRQNRHVDGSQRLLQRQAAEHGCADALLQGAWISAHIPARYRRDCETRFRLFTDALPRRESGIELYTHDSREELEECFEIDIDPRFTRSANFRWSSSADEGVVALCFSGALAKLLNGAVLDVDGETILTAGEAIARAREELKDLAPPPKQRTTRPADIRHYLKPLLEQRDDLVLVGRMLLIRPMRHLLRGAFLDRTSDRYSFRLSRACDPLYMPDGRIDDILHDGAFYVWQPHFEPLLTATLADEVFEPLGRMTTLVDFSSRRGGDTPYPFAQVTSLVLAGERDRAAACAEEIERKYESLAAEMRQHWEGLSADIESTCAKYHAKEAATVKAMKLERFWEPSPFPVELPASERESKSAERLFVTQPWPAPPSWLWQACRTRLDQSATRRRFSTARAISRCSSHSRRKRPGSVIMSGRLTFLPRVLTTVSSL